MSWTKLIENKRLNNIYHKMKSRCYNQNDPAYHNYGGRGIKVCSEWLKGFNKFKIWAFSNGYKSNLTIDRIDNNGNYEPNNCRWITLAEQSNNKRTNVFINKNGEYLTITQYAEKYKLNRDRIYHRLYKGWSIEDAISKKIRSYKKNDR